MSRDESAAAYTDSKSAPEGAAHHGAEVEGPAGEEPVASSSGDADGARQSSSPAASAAQRRPECVERWPECESGAYDPRCCRFPKSCSCNVRPEEIAAYSFEKRAWEPQCPHGDICTGCDARGYCTRMEGPEARSAAHRRRPWWRARLRWPGEVGTLTETYRWCRLCLRPGRLHHVRTALYCRFGWPRV